MDAALRELFSHGERVPLVYWREFSGAKTAVLATGAVGVLAFVTGLSHLSQGTVSLDGPLAVVVPAGRGGVVPLAGVVLGFLLGAVAAGMQRRYRLAWWGATTALPLAMLFPLVTAEVTDVLLFVGAVGTLPVVVRNRAGFDRRVDLSPFQTAALATFLAVQIYGTIGAYVLREDYTGIETWTDAFYYIVVTGTTVGYGDATPTTQDAKLFTLSVLVVGTATFGAVFGSFIVPALESRLTAAFGTMTASELTLLEDHVVVLGSGDLTEPLLDELDAEEVVVITLDTEAASALRDRDVSVLTDDPTDTEALLDARVDAARGVVAATDDDARNTLAIIAARQANPDVRIVAAATDQRHVDKLEGVGADRVISPAVIGGRLLGRSVRGEADPLLEGTETGADTDADAAAPADAATDAGAGPTTGDDHE
jgi:voltage-gated potassium channel